MAKKNEESAKKKRIPGTFAHAVNFHRAYRMMPMMLAMKTLPIPAELRKGVA